MDERISKIIKHFNIKGEVISCEPYGCGHINETYLVKVIDNKKEVLYILQKIDSSLFTDVEKLMHNIELVTSFMRERIIKRGGNPDRECLTFLKTKDDKSYYHDIETNGYYRISIFITDAVVYQVVSDKNAFYQTAIAFGEFAKLLADFDASKLYEILPKFHDTRKRYNDFIDTLNKDKLNRAKDIKDEIDFVKKRKDYAGKIVSLLESGEMPLKVTHNDTKLNNVMFDKKTGNYLAVLDLDTVMPGSICYDFGDAIRYGCNPALEDKRDLSKVNFNFEYFTEFVKGYLKSLGSSVKKIEKDNFVMGAIVITYECGMRFLTDYLDGDHYFRTHRENQNLDRARTQFKLVLDMEKHIDKLQEIVNKY